MNKPVSLLIPCGADPGGLPATVASARRQTVPAQIVAAVTTPAAADRARRHADAVVRVRAPGATRGRSLNAAAEAAAAPVHATVPCGAALPRADWLERILAHYERPEVVGVSGDFVGADHQALLEPQDLDGASWSPSWGFSNASSSWLCEAWERHRFNETMRTGEDSEWAWRTVRDDGVLVIDPFVAVGPLARRRAHSLGILRRSASEWCGLVAAGAPVEAMTPRAALRSWWRDIDPSSPTPAQLQRLNWFRIARIAGRWIGGRRARGARARK